MAALSAFYPESFSGKGGRAVTFCEDPRFNGLRITAAAEGGISITYARPSDAYRAIGLLMAGEENVEEHSSFSTIGVMLDVSRNAVIRPSVYPSLFAKLALMGINCVLLYMEDTYQLPGEPFFGYGRGGYTPTELKQIDDDAARFGIELIPCIQTLGHLAQVLQWPIYRPIADTRDILLVGDAGTYALIGKMLDTLAGCFRSKRIHIGMDEAHGIGTGRYRERNGNRNPFEILSEHLDKVGQLCRERGLEPMIWSDMYFRLGSATGDYYDRDASIPEWVTIPDHIELVYWDYYHSDPEFYSEWIRRHRALGKEPVFAAGAWTWGRLWAHFSRATTTVNAGMVAAKREGLKETFLTIWGDDGAECEPISMLATIQYFAESAYTAKPCTERLHRLFLASSGGDFKGCLTGHGIDRIPGTEADPEGYANYGKWLLWHDPVYTFLEHHIPPGLPEYYRQLARELEGRTSTPGVRFVALLAKALALKTQIHLGVRSSYRLKNKRELRQILDITLPECIAALEALWKHHRTIWDEWYKPFGWEILELRYAGVVARLRHLESLLAKHLDDPSKPVEVLELEPSRLYPEENQAKVYFNYVRASSPTTCR